MPHSPNQPSFWQRNLDKIGIGGAAFAALCCLGFPALLAIVSAAGLGFLINDAVLLPLLAISLLITLWGLYSGIRHHHNWSAFGIGVVGAVSMGLSIMLGTALLAGVGIAALILASLLNILLRVRCQRHALDA
jgi:mercuric ion transport protein